MARAARAGRKNVLTNEGTRAGRRVMLSLMVAASPLAMSQAMAQALPAGTRITPTGETGTTVTSAGQQATIETTTVNNRTGFNAFNAFTVGQDFTVNMAVPTNADRLVNVVKGEAVSISGILNSYKGTVAPGNRGGDIYFVAPRGFVIGASGVVNVGSLTVTTPKDSIAQSIITDRSLPAATYGLTDIAETGVVTVSGKVNAIDGVKLGGRTVTIEAGGRVLTGAAALVAVDAQNARIFGAVVNAQNLEQGGAIVYNGGTIEIVGQDAVTINGQLTATAGSMPANAAGTITVSTSGQAIAGRDAEIVASRNNGTLAGKVTIAASKSDTNYMGKLTSETSVGISGIVKGGEVDISATSSSIVSYTDMLQAFTAQAIGGGSLLGLNGGYQDAVSKANLTVDGTAKITASTDLKLSAISTATTDLPVVASSVKSPVQVAIIAALVTSDAKVLVTGAAELTAGGKLDITAQNTTKLDATAKTLNTAQVDNELLGVAIAYGKVVNRTEAKVGADTIVDAGTVSVRARNDHSLSVSGSAMVNSDGKVGFGFAMSEQDIQTRASFDAALGHTVAGVAGKAASLSVTALTDTTLNKTSADSSVGNAIGGKIVTAATDGLSTISNKIKGLVTKAGPLDAIANEGDANKHFRMGGALSLAFDEQVTEATIGSAARKINLTGDAIVAARTINSGLRNIANSGVASNDEATKNNGATTVGVSAGLSYADHDFKTLATIAEGAEIVAGRLAVGAETIAPLTITWQDWDTPSKVTSHLNGNLGLANTIASSFATSTASAENVGVAGSVNINLLGAETRAWVGEKAKITVGPAGNGFADGIGMDWSKVASTALTVTALSQIEGIHIGGQFSLLLGGNESGSMGKSKSVGGSFTMPSQKAVTIAGIGAGAAVNAPGGVGVNARSDNRLIAVAPSTGKGLGVGVVGLATYAVVDNETKAVISNLAKIDASSVALTADQDFLIVNVAAPIPVKAEGSGVGMGVAINAITTDTVAGIVDTAAITTATGVTMAAGWTPYVNTSALNVDASNDGWLAAFGLAGVMVDNDPDREPLGNKVKDPFKSTKLGSYLGSAEGDSGYLRTKVAGLLASKPTPAPGGKPADFSLAAAGSAAVNLSELKARATVADAKIGRYAGAGATDITLTATNTPFAMTGAGAGAKVSAGGATSVGIGGAVAVDISENDAVAEMRNVVVTHADDVAVRALNGGVRVAAGLAVALNTPPAGQKAGEAAAAVSASIVINRDTAHAHVDDSTITGVAGGSGRNIDVTAYNAPKIAAGGGAGYEGGQVGAGFAVTVVDMGDDGAEAATEALVRDTIITQVDTVTVNAADPSIVLALAATGGKGAANIGLVGAGAYIGSDRTSRAGIGRIDGTSTIGASGDVKVTTTALKDSGLEAISVARGGGDLKAATGYDFTGNATIGDLRSENYDDQNDRGLRTKDGKSLVEASGNGGLMIAAGGSGQKSGSNGQNAKGNVGASFSGIIVEDDRQAFVDYATVTAGTLGVKATDDAVRVGLAVGGSGGADFGATGSVTLIEDNGVTRARIGDAAGTRTTVNADTVSVTAADASVAAALSGSFTMAGKAALGAAVSHVASSKAVSATVANTNANVADRLDIDAALSGAVFNLAFSGAVASSQLPVDLPALDAEEGGGVAQPGGDVGGGDVGGGGVGGGSGGGGVLAIGGASASNILTSSAKATLIQTTVAQLNAKRAAVTVGAEDSQFVLAGAIGFARANKGAGGVGLVTNRRGGAAADGLRAAAVVTGGSIDAANVIVRGQSSADIKSLAVGIAIGDKFAGGGSIVTNIIDGDTKALVDGGANITAQNNAGVLARSQDRLDVIGGGVGFSKAGTGLGISITTNVMNADTIAAVEGVTTKLSALGKSTTGLTVFEGGLDSTPDLTAIGESQAGLVKTLGVKTKQVTGIAVNASTLNNVNVAAVSVGAGKVAGIGGNVATTVMAGATEARVVGASLNTASGADGRQQLDLAASDHSMFNSLVGAVGASAKAGIAGGLDLAFLSRDVKAYSSAAELNARGAMRIAATSSQYRFGLNLGVGAGKVGIAGAISVSQFDAGTYAYADGGTLTADDLDITADNRSGSTIATGVGAFGTVAVGGGVSVITSNNKTLAATGVSGIDDTSLTRTDVNARSTSIAADRNAEFNLFTVGAAVGKVGVAAMGSVLLTSDHTRAGAFNTTLQATDRSSDAADLTVHAREAIDATIGTGAGAGGVVGVAGAVTIGISSNTVEAVVDGSRTKATTQKVEAIADRDFDAKTVSVGVGKVGVAAAIGVLKLGGGALGDEAAGADTMLDLIDTLSSDGPVGADVGAAMTEDERTQLTRAMAVNAAARATGTPSLNGTSARVLGSQIAGALDVNALDTTVTRQDAGSGAGGLVGVGAGVTVTDVRNAVTAEVNAASTLSGGGLRVQAKADGHAIDNNAYVGAAGGVGVGAGVAVGTVANTVSASAGGKLTGTGTDADLLIGASDETTLSSNIYNVVVGGAGAAGGTVSMLTKDSVVTARTLGDARTDVDGYRGVAITASGLGRIAAEGIGAAAGGVVGVQGAYVEAKDSTKVTASLGVGKYGYAATGIKVNAVRTPDVYAHVIGVTVGGMAALGASAAKALVEDDVTADTAANVVLTSRDVTQDGVSRKLAADLTVLAEMKQGTNHTAFAEAASGAGGGLVGADAAIAIALNSSNIYATVGNDLRMDFGSLAVKADRQSSQKSDVLGISAGTLALGATYSETGASGNITATLGSGVVNATGGDAALGLVSVVAGGKDVLDTKSTAGSGGVIAGAAALAITNHTTAVKVDVLAPATAKAITTGSLTLLGDYEVRTKAIADSTQASVLGGSGADAKRKIDTSVTVAVGANATFDTLDATVAAYQRSYVADGGATAAAGGLFNGAAGLSRTDITPETKVTFGRGSGIDVLGVAGFAPGRLSIQAANTVNASDSAKLDVGSGIPIAQAKTAINSTTDNTIEIGENVQLTAVGQIDIGAYSINAARTEAKVSTYGGVGAAGGDSDAEVTANHTVSLASGAKVSGGDRVNIGAGTSGRGINATLSATAINDVYNYTALPVDTSPDVKARAINNSTLTINSGATVESIRDVSLTAHQGIRNAYSDGTGHNPYLEAFSSTIDRDDHLDTGNATMVLNGTVAAGIRAKQTVAIGADGTVTRGPVSGGVSVERDVYKVRSALQSKVDELAALDTGAMTEEQRAQHNGELAVFRQLLAEAPPEPLTAAQRQAATTRRENLVANRVLVAANAPLPAEDGGSIVMTDQQKADTLKAIDDEITGIDSQLAATAFPTTYGQAVGNMYAAAGNVAVDAKTLSGSGSVKAEGGATISIVNNSRDYLIVNNLFIPDGDSGSASGGRVEFKSGAARGSLNVTETDKDVLPTITVSNTATSGNAGIFLQGQISNLGGAIEVTNQTGSIAQFAPVAGRTASITAPNGTYAVNMPNSTFPIGGVPEAVWRPFVLLPGNASIGASMVANYMYNRNPDGSQKYTDAEQFTRSMLDISCGDRCISPILFNDMINRKNVDDGNFRWAYSGNGSFFGMSNVGIYGLTRTFAAPQPTLDPADGITARTLIVNAARINIAAPARIGRNNNYSATIASTLDGDIAAIRQAAALRGVTLTGTVSLDRLAETYGAVSGWAPFINLLSGRTSVSNVGLRNVSTRNGDQRIGLAYDFDNNQLVANDVDGAGGGSIRLTGAIFSTTTYGALQVNSGFGDIKIVNDSTAGLELGNIDTGRGAVGRIQITDLNKTGFGTKNLTTWYIYDNATGKLATYNNAANGADDYIGLAPISMQIGQATTYNPEAGFRYAWQLSRSAQRYVVPGMYSDQFEVYRQGASEWQWNESDWAVSGQRFYKASSDLPFFSEQISGYVTGTNQTANGYYNLGFYTTDGSFSWGAGRHDKYVNAVTAVQVNANMSVKADNAVAIRFTGNAAANVDVQSRGQVSLKGNISNPTGTTSITQLAGLGGIVGMGGGIETTNLTLSGRTIGSVADPLSVVLNGTLNATANAGGIGLTVAGLARIGEVRANGDVKLAATQGIIGLDGATITGRNLDLSSSAGAITGFNGGALTIQATSSLINGNTVGGELNAVARDAINLSQATGDVRLKQLVSTSGDVTLEATSGSIRNAIAEFRIDADNQQRLADVWSELGLTDTTSVLKAVGAFERDIVTQQAERVRLYNQMTIANGVVTGIGNPALDGTQNAAARTIYAAQAKAQLGLGGTPSDAQIIAYVQGRLDAIEVYATQVFGAVRPTGFETTDRNASFTFKLDPNSARYKELTRGVWTESQLAQSISGTALVPVDNTTILQQDPNVSGRNVVLNAASAIGQNLAPVAIVAQAGKVLTTEERAILAAAGPGDLRVEAIAGGGNRLIVSQQRLVNVSASGTVSAKALGDLYLGSAGSVAVGNIATSGTARINLAGSLTNAAVGNAAAITARDLILEASGGSIGTVDRALAVQVGGTLLSARAGRDVRIDQLAGDLTMGVGFANGLFSLRAARGSILSAFGNTEEVRLQAGSMNLTARGALGTASARLQVQVGTAGTLTGHAASADIYSPTALLRVGGMRFDDAAVFGGRDLAFVGELTAKRLSAIAAGTLSVVDRLSIGASVDLVANTLMVADGARIDLNDSQPGALTLKALAGGMTIGGANGASLGTKGDVVLASGAGLTFSGIIHGRELRLDATGDLTVAKASQFEGKGRIGIDAASLAVGDGARLLATGFDVNVRGSAQFGTDVDFDGSQRDTRFAAGSLMIGAGSTWRTGVTQIRLGGSLTTADDVGFAVDELQIDGEDIAFGKRNAISASTSLKLDARGALTADEGLDLIAGYLDLKAGGALALGVGAKLDAMESLTLAGRSIAVSSDSALRVSGISGARRLSVDAGHDGLSIGSRGVLSSTGSVSLRSDGRLGLDSAMSVTARNDLTFEAASMLAIDRLAVLRSNEGAVALRGAIVSVGRGTRLTAANGFLASGGDIGFVGDAVIEAASVMVDADRTVDLGEGSTLIATGDVNVLADGAINLGSRVELRSMDASIDIAGASVAGSDSLRVTARQGVTMSAASGALTLGNGAKLGGTTIALTARDAVAVGNTAALAADRTIALRGGSILLGYNAALKAADTTTFVATTGNITLGANASLASDIVKIDAQRGGLAIGNAVGLTARSVAIAAGDIRFGNTASLNADDVAIGARGAAIFGDDAHLAVRKSLTIDAQNAVAFGTKAQMEAPAQLRVTGQGITIGDDATLQGGAVSLVSTGAIDLGDRSLIAAGDTLTIDGRDTVRFGGLAALMAGKALTLTGGRVTFGSDASLSARQLAVRSAGVLSFGNNATLKAAERIGIDGITSVSFGAGATLGSIGGDIVLAGGTVDFGDRSTLNAGGKLGFTTRTGKLGFGDAARLVSGSALTLNVVTDATFGRKAVLTAADALTLSAGGSATFADGATLKSGADAVLAGSSLRFGNAALVSAGHALTLDARSGGIAFGDGAGLTAGRDFKLQASTNGMFGRGTAITAARGIMMEAGRTLSFAEDVQLDAKDMIGIDAASLAVGDRARLRAAGFTVSVDGSAEFGANVVIDGSQRDTRFEAGSLALGAGTTWHTGATQINVDGSMTMANDVSFAVGALTIDADDIVFGERNSVQANARLALNARKALTAAERLDISAGILDVNAGGALTLGNGAKLGGTVIALTARDAVVIGSTAALTADRTIALRGGSILLGDDATLKAAERIGIDGITSVWFGSGATLGSTGGDIMLAGGTVDFGDRSTLNAGGKLGLTTRTGKLVFGEAARLVSGSGLTLNVVTDATFGRKAVLTAADALTLSAGGSATFADGATLKSGADTVLAGSSLRFGNAALVNAGHALALDARSGAIAFGDGAGLTTGRDFKLQASTDGIFGRGTAITAARGIMMEAGRTLSFAEDVQLDAKDMIGIDAANLAVGDRTRLRAAGFTVSVDGSAEFEANVVIDGSQRDTRFEAGSLALGTGTTWHTGATQIDVDGSMTMANDVSFAVGALTIDADDIVFGERNSVQANARLALNARNALTAAERLDISAGILDLNAGGALTLGNGAKLGGTMIALRGGSILLGDDAAFRASDATTFVATAGNITLGANASLASDIVTIDAQRGGLAIGNAVRMTAKSVAIAAGDIRFGNTASLNADDVAIGARGTAIFGDDAHLAVRKSLTIDAQNAVVFGTKARTEAPAQLRVKGQGITIGDDATLQGGAVSLVSTGAIGLGDRSLIAASDTLTIDGRDTVRFGGLTALTAGESVAVMGARVAFGADASLTTRQLAVRSADVLSFGNNATLKAAERIGIDGIASVSIGAGATLGSTGGDIVLAGGTVDFGDRSTLNAGGKLGIETRTGKLIFGDAARLVSGSGLTLNVVTDATFGRKAVLTAADALTLSAGGSATLADGAVLKSGADTVLAGSSLRFGNAALVNAGHALTLDARSGAIAFGDGAGLTAGRDFKLQASTDGIFGRAAAITAAGGIMMEAGGIALGDAADLKTGTTLALIATGDVTLGQGTRLAAGTGLQLSAARSLAIAAGSRLESDQGAVTMTAADVVFADDVRLVAERGLTIDADNMLAIGDAVFARSANGEVGLGANQLRVGDDAQIEGTTVALTTRGGALVIGDRGRMAAERTLLLSSKGSFSTGNAADWSGSDIVLSASTARLGETASLRTRDSIAITITDFFASDDRLSLAGGRHIGIDAGGDLRIGQGATAKAPVIALTGAALAIGDIARLDATSIELAARRGAITIGNRAELRAASELTADAQGTVSFGSGALLRGMTVAATGNDVLLGDAADIAAIDAVTLTARNGDVTARAAGIAANTVTVKAARDLMLSGSNLSARDLALSAGHDASLDRAEMRGGALALAAARDLSFSDTRATLVEGVQLTAGRTLTMGGNTTVIAGAIQVKADAIIAGSGRFEARRTLAMEAANALRLGAGSDLRSGMTIALNAGNLAMDRTARVDAGSDLSLQTGADLVADGTMIAGGTIDFAAGGTLLVGDASAGGTVAARSGGTTEIGRIATRSSAADAIRLVSGGAIVGRVSSPLHLSAGQGGVLLAADSGIGLATTPLRIDTRSVRFQSRTGDVNLKGTGSFAISGDAQAGNVQVGSTGALAVRGLNATNITLDSDGAMVWSGGRFENGRIAAAGGFTGDSLEAFRSFAMYAPTVSADVKGIGDGPLTLKVAGLGDGALTDRADVSARSPVAIVFDQLRVQNARLAIDAPRFTVTHGFVGRRVDLSLPQLNMLYTRQRVPGEAVTIQARAATSDFTLDVQGRRVTTDAVVMGGRAARPDGGFIDPSMMMSATSGRAAERDPTGLARGGTAAAAPIAEADRTGDRRVDIAPVNLPVDATDAELIVVGAAAS